MKSILYITNIPAPYTVEFFNDLGENYDLTVVFEGKNSSERDQSWEKFNAKNFKFIIIGGGGSKNPINQSKQVKNILLKKKYDLYIVGDYSTLVGMTAISWLRRHKCSYAIHADGGLIGKDSFIKYQVKRYLLRDANLYFSSGTITTEYFVHYGAHRERIFEYPFSSVRLNQIRKDIESVEYRKKIGIPLDQKIIVSVGQIIPRKGFDILIKAVSMMESKPKLYIIGGKATPDLEEMIKQLKLENVEFVSFLPFETILEYMAASDLFVLLTREDIWGLVINEAFAMGTPVISTNRCVAAVEMIEDGKNGYVVEVENPELAAKRMDYLLDNEDLCNEIRKNNLHKAKQYTIESMTKAYCNIIDNYLGD